MHALVPGFAFVLVLAGLGTVGIPHDTWLLQLPSDDRSAVLLSLRTGINFPTSDNAVAPANVRGWLLEPHGGKQALPAFVEDGATKSTTCRLGALSPGLYVATADTEPERLQLTAKKFNDYLLHDGLPHVLAARMDADEEQRDATEQYRKCAKVVFRSGDAGGGRCDAPLGQRLEIIPLDDPTTLAPRATLRVRVLFDGAPLARANLCWDLPDNGEDLAGCTWTDARGEALVPIKQPGWMTVRLVHMTRPRLETHEYESFWATCAFVVGG